VDSYIYFANVRPDYKWGYFSDTLVYAYNQYDRPESIVVFYNTVTGEKYTKYVKNLLHVCAHGEFCALITRVDEDLSSAAVTQYIIILCNAIASPVELKCAPVQPFLPTASFCNRLRLGTFKSNPSSLA
jgi:WD repeat-containing protein 35